EAANRLVRAFAGTVAGEDARGRDRHAVDRGVRERETFRRPLRESVRAVGNADVGLVDGFRCGVAVDARTARVEEIDRRATTGGFEEALRRLDVRVEIRVEVRAERFADART